MGTHVVVGDARSSLAEDETAEARSTMSRWAGLAGLAFAISVGLQNILSVAAGIDPDLDASAAQILDKLVRNGDSYGLLFASVGMNIALLMIFLGGAYARLRSAAPSWATIGLVGGILLVAFFALSNAPLVALTVHASALANNLVIVDLLWDMHLAMFAFASISLGIALLGLSVAAVRARLLPTWFGVVGPVGAAVIVGASVPVKAVAQGSPATMVGLLGFLVWLVFLVMFGSRMWRERD